MHNIAILQSFYTVGQNTLQYTTKTRFTMRIYTREKDH